MISKIRDQRRFSSTSYALSRPVIMAQVSFRAPQAAYTAASMAPVLKTALAFGC